MMDHWPVQSAQQPRCPHWSLTPLTCSSGVGVRGTSLGGGGALVLRRHSSTWLSWELIRESELYPGTCQPCRCGPSVPSALSSLDVYYPRGQELCRGPLGKSPADSALFSLPALVCCLPPEHCPTRGLQGQLLSCVCVCVCVCSVCVCAVCVRGGGVCVVLGVCVVCGAVSVCARACVFGGVLRQQR